MQWSQFLCSIIMQAGHKWRRGIACNFACSPSAGLLKAERECIVTAEDAEDRRKILKTLSSHTFSYLNYYCCCICCCCHLFRIVKILFVTVPTASSSVVVSTSAKLPRCIIITRINATPSNLLSFFGFFSYYFAPRWVQGSTNGDSFRVDLFQFIRSIEMLIVLFAFWGVNEIINWTWI